MTRSVKVVGYPVALFCNYSSYNCVVDVDFQFMMLKLTSSLEVLSINKIKTDVLAKRMNLLMTDILP